mmetsp:Transcript_23276/g.39742  ORF Transcript_23276/g.39742 Transcript_23276/m.39742 type:complete len:202 (+) Transcript_23276:267-872(+)
MTRATQAPMDRNATRQVRDNRSRIELHCTIPIRSGSPACVHQLHTLQPRPIRTSFSEDDVREGRGERGRYHVGGSRRQRPSKRFAALGHRRSSLALRGRARAVLARPALPTPAHGERGERLAAHHSAGEFVPVRRVEHRLRHHDELFSSILRRPMRALREDRLERISDPHARGRGLHEPALRAPDEKFIRRCGRRAARSGT